MKRILSIMACMIITALTTMTADAQGMAASEYVLSKLHAHDMVFMGTTHRQTPILGLLAEVLPYLHSAGVTHVALEIASDQQGRIDHYLNTGNGLDEIGLHAAIDCSEYRHLLAIVEGMPASIRPQVRAVDLPPDRYDGPVTRDQWMAAELRRIVRERPGGKVLVVLGSMHVLRKLDWENDFGDAHVSIRTRLRDDLPDLSMVSIVNIVGANEPDCDFGRFFGMAPGPVALDLDERFASWTLGLTRCIAIHPGPAHELVEGVIVY